MRRTKVLLIAALGVAALVMNVLAALGPAAPAGAATKSAPAPAAKSVTLNASKMHAAYLKALAAKPKAEPKIIWKANGKSETIRPDTSVACITASCGDLTPGTGSAPEIQRHPQIYLLLWGPEWSTDTTIRPALENYMAGLGNEDSYGTSGDADQFSSTLHQYGESDGSPWFYHHGVLGAVGSTYADSYLDTSTPPADATDAQLQSEVQAFASTEGITLGHQQTVVVASQQGTCPAGTPGTGCPTPTSCSYHSFTTIGSSILPWVNLDYGTDAYNGGCTPQTDGEDVATAIMSHEVSETVLNPAVNGSWQGAGGEVADECPGYSAPTFGNGLTATVQSLYSNAAADASGVSGQGCTYSSGPLGPVVGGTTCVTNESGTTTNLNPVNMETCALTTASGFQMFTNDPDAHHLNVQGKCLQDPSDGGTGTLVNVYNCNTSVQEKWTFVPDSADPPLGQWTVANNGTRCLHRFNTGTNQMDVETCSTSVGNQLFYNVDADNP
jgi:hypothetical protein